MSYLSRDFATVSCVALPLERSSGDMDDETWMLIDVIKCRDDEIQLARKCVADLKNAIGRLRLISSMRKNWGQSGKLWEGNELDLDAKRAKELADKHAWHPGGPFNTIKSVSPPAGAAKS
ncbi:hypothetical protein BDZ89DRAFT_1146929 [Hymenopellis radicata]|nr:hypothetical protein BDZ89DRAFT_1146929 [Hymenopellis radicata]